jgi:hypothetical protein
MDNENAPARLRTIDRLLTAGLGVAALVLYWSTLAPTVLEADAGEFQFVPWLPGIAHPTGYPLYVLLGWLWSHLLPLGDVAWRMNLLSAVCAAVAVMVLYRLTGLILAQVLPQTPAVARLVSAAVAAATFAVSQTFWLLSLIAEVYTLHVLLLGLMLWLALRAGVYQARRDTLLLALVFGLGLAHHVTTVLLIPALLVYLWLAGVVRKTPVWWLQHGVVAAVPLLLYLTLPVVAPTTPYATIQLSESQPALVLYENSPSGFLQHVTATVFRGDLRPAAVGLDRFKLVAELLHQQISWVGIGLAIIGLVALVRTQNWPILALTGLAFLGIITFNLIYFIGDVFVLFTPAWLLVCVWLGIGLLTLTDQLSRTFVRARMGVPEEAAFGSMKKTMEKNMTGLVTTGLSLFFFALPVWLAINNLAVVNQRDNNGAALRWQTILNEPLPTGAILISNDRNEIMPMWYFQYVEQQRPDLVGLFPLIVAEPAYGNVGRVLDQALASQRPVYLIKAMDGLDLKADISPVGTLFAATPLPTKTARPMDNPLPDSDTRQISLTAVEVTPETVSPGTPLTITLYWQANSPLPTDYTSYIHLLSADGQRLAQSDHQPGGVYYPSSLWQPGETLRDRHVIELPPQTLPGEVRLVAGIYHQPQPGQIETLGNSIDLGVIHLE